MHMIIRLYNSIFSLTERLAGDWLLPSLARFTFAATLLFYFWGSAYTKLGDGILGFLSPSTGAYAQIFPNAFEAVNYDSSQLGIFHWFVVMAGMYAEFILPALILLGLFTRLAAVGMIGFVFVQSLTDIYGHGATEYGAWFDRASDGVIMDQRLFWITTLVILVLKGAGPFSLDRILRNRTGIDV